MIEELKELARDRIVEQSFDSLALSVIDFKKNDFESFNLFYDDLREDSLYFDLASLTKPFTLSFPRLFEEKLFADEKLDWLLCHRGSLPVGGRLSRGSWREQILSYPIEYSQDDLYSDYSALRLMLELERESKTNLYDLCQKLWDREIVHWSELAEPLLSPSTGWRRGREIRGQVHDDNAFVLKEKLSHAGLFGTIEGVSRNLLILGSKLDFIGKAIEKTEPHRRFVLGFDRVQDPKITLAGTGASLKTFGHLGFTGTSFWIDSEKGLGWVLLTNATQESWYDRAKLQELRRDLGAVIWKSR